MAEAVVGATVEVLLQNLIAFSVEEIGLIWNFTDDLKSLKDSVAMIRDFLEDAERRQVTDKSVQRWLMKLEAVAFDADYVFDQLNYQLIRKKVQRGTKMKKKVRCFFPNSKSVAFRYRMAREIKNIQDKLKLINQEAKDFGLHQVRIASLPSHGVGSGLETNSLSVDPVFVGRENDAMKIVEMVNNRPTENKVSVIPIVGMGGLGKTTLARKVFHDDTIISRFENRFWVYVSENFVPKTVFKNVFESLTGENIDGSEEFVLRKLREKIGEKTYFLVLDDVWSEDTLEWDKFITSLEGISPVKGNVVLVTTRKGNVASTVKTIDTHELGVLSKDDCWGIIKAKAFEGDNIPTEFEIVGKRIAQRCGGLPLAAKVVGSLLRGKPESEWRSIENKWLPDSGGENDSVSKILKLSFDNLPSPTLKKSFAYCSILPKGWFIEREKLIHLWMAEGFLQTDQVPDMEIAGNEVFNVLLQSSLLQVQERNDYGKVIRGYGMHDLVHDLASSILNYKFLEGAHQVRYKSIPLIDKSSLIPKEHAKCLRGLFCGGKIFLLMFSKLKCLHVLILNDGEMKELPIEIGKLISLRLLDISNTKMEYLPDSIGDLYHLQTLRATKNGGIGYLRKLPNTFKLLTSLRHLYIPFIELPPEIGKVSSLRTLPYFQVGDEEGSRIVELGSLKNLEGEMEIHNLEKVRDKEEARNADLFHKPNMLKLKLVWSESREDDHSNDEKVLEGLQPHSSLKCLEIEGFRGTSFPSWTMRMDFDNLLEIKLSKCSKCEEIPMLGHLPHLKSLYLSHLSNVKSMGSSFYGIKEDDGNKEMIMVFPALEKLVLHHMINLTSWTEVELSSLSTTQPREALVFHRLEYLKMNNCRPLKSAPSHFPVLKELEIDEMESGVPLASICGSKLTTLTKLKLGNVDGVVCLPDLLFNNNHDLLELDIERCSNLTHLVPCLGGGGASLRKLNIEYCENLVELPEDVDKLNALEELSIMSCPKLKSIAYPSGTQLSSQGFTSLRRLYLWGCSGLISMPCEMLESCAQSLKMLNLRGSESLTNLPQVLSILHKMSHLTELAIELRDVVVEIGSLRSINKLTIGGDWISPHNSQHYVLFDRIFPAIFQSLRRLELHGREEWDGLPEQFQNLTTLHVLTIIGFGIEVLPEWLERLSSLRTLRLFECKKLRHLPSKKAMQALTKLKDLAILYCPVLEQELKQQGSDDDSERSKVSHIPYVYVNGITLLDWDLWGDLNGLGAMALILFGGGLSEPLNF